MLSHRMNANDEHSDAKGKPQMVISAIALVLTMFNFVEWYAWILTEMTMNPDCKGYAMKGVKPTFRMPPRSVKNGAGDYKDAAEWAGPDGLEMWKIGLHRLSRREDAFEGGCNRFMRLILNAISAELLDKMRLSNGFDDSERDRTLHAMLNIARLVSTGHGAASVYMDFLKLSSVKMEGGTTRRRSPRTRG